MKKIHLIIRTNQLAKKLTKSLSEIGYEVAAVSQDLDRSMELFEKVRPDLVLVELPDDSDMEAFPCTEKLCELFEAPVALLLGMGEEESPQEAAAIAPYGCINVSSGPVELRNSIEMALGKYASDKKLKESENKYQSLVEQSVDGIVVVQGKTIRFANRAFAKMFGHDNEDAMLGRNFLDYVAPEYREIMYKRGVQREKGQPGPDCYEFTALTKDGTPFPAEIRVGLTSYMGETARQGIVRDITDRIKAQEDLRLESKIMSRIYDGICLVRASDGSIVRTNRRFEEMFGYEPGELLGKHISIVNAPTDKSPEEMADDIIRSVRRQGVWKGEIHNIRKDGTTLWCSLSITSFETSRYGTVWISVNRDITDWKKVHKQIEDSLDEKVVLLREIHHRVKNNLAIISSLLNLQSKFSSDGTHTGVFKDCQERIRSMALAHEILYRSENVSDIRAPEYIKILANQLGEAYGTIGKAITLKMNLEEISLSLDTALPLGSILTELVSNCYKHAFNGLERGEISISFNRADEYWLELIVKDNGTGIPDHGESNEGKSLGLRLVETFGKQLNGKVEIQGGNGATIRVIFPQTRRKSMAPIDQKAYNLSI